MRLPVPLAWLSTRCERMPKEYHLRSPMRQGVRNREKREKRSVRRVVRISMMMS